MILVITTKHFGSDKRIYRNEILTFLALGLDVDYLFFNGSKDDLSLHRDYRDKITLLQGNSSDSFVKKFLFITNICCQRKYKYIHIHDPNLLLIVPFLKLINKKLIYDCHEIYYYTIQSKTYIKLGILRLFIARIFLIYEKYCMNLVDQIIFVSNHQKLFFKKNKALVITNFPYKRHNNSILAFSKRLIFAGNISRNYLLEVILDSIENTDIVFTLMGRCYDEEYLDYLKTLKGWSNVEYLGFCKFEDVIKEYEKGGVGVFLHKYTGNVGYKEGSDGILKIYEYMSYGLPVIMTDFNNLLVINECYEFGISCGNDVSGFKMAINKVFLESNYKKYSSGSILAHLEKFNWDFVVKTIKKYYLPIHD